MDMYIRMFDDLKRQVDDNPTIGIIFCTDKDETMVKYSVLNESKQIFASKYMTVLPTVEELRDEWNAADKLKVVKEYLAGHDSFVKLGRKYQLNESSIRKWVAKYKTFGENAFMIRSANLNYSAAFKEEVVKAYLHGEGSYKDIAIKYKIADLKFQIPVQIRKDMPTACYACPFML